MTPTAFLGRPVAKIIPPTSSRIPLPSLDVSGVLKPRHKAGSAAVVLEVWSNGLDGVWKPIKTVRARVHDGHGVSVYSLKVMDRIAPVGAYKVKAIHADADHVRTESAFSATVRP